MAGLVSLGSIGVYLGIHVIIMFVSAAFGSNLDPSCRTIPDFLCGSALQAFAEESSPELDSGLADRFLGTINKAKAIFDFFTFTYRDNSILFAEDPIGKAIGFILILVGRVSILVGSISLLASVIRR